MVAKGVILIWTDNLFTSTYSLFYARSLGVGMAGTCRTTKTRRENKAGEAA